MHEVTQTFCMAGTTTNLGSVLLKNLWDDKEKSFLLHLSSLWIWTQKPVCRTLRFPLQSQAEVVRRLSLPLPGWSSSCVTGENVVRPLPHRGLERTSGIAALHGNASPGPVLHSLSERTLVMLTENTEGLRMDKLNSAFTENPIVLYTLEGNLQGLQSIFEDPADVHHEQGSKLLLEEDLLGRNPLYLACILGRTDIVRMLVKFGANINQQTTRGYLPLHCAAAWGHLEVLKTIVELGGDILLLNFRGEKACDIAARYNKTDCAEFLQWAEARLALKTYISFIQQTISDPEKVQGRLHKDDKHLAMNACKAKNEWLENSKNPTTQDFVDQKLQLESTMQSVFTKLNTPRAETGKFKR